MGRAGGWSIAVGNEAMGPILHLAVNDDGAG
jgi:hypothetical protein